ncbi:MAG: hypothetical protein WA192_03855 [Candidatus Acidiferrales bacterium]
MATITCEQFLVYLESWMEGERPAELQAHLRICLDCQEVVGELQAIRSEARGWSAHEVQAPERVWTALRAQLEEEGLIRETVPAREDGAENRAGWLGGWFRALPRPVLAGAYLAALVAVAFALSGPVNRRVNEARWLKGTEISTSPLNAQLNFAEQNSNSYLLHSEPEVSASLHKNLAIVDNYIALCKKSVSEEPQNEIARDYLYEAYQQKADLLTQITERGENVQ